MLHWYHLYNLKSVKNIQGGVIHLVKLQASASNFTERITSPWVFSTFLKLYKWYQIAQSITNSLVGGGGRGVSTTPLDIYNGALYNNIKCFLVVSYCCKKNYPS